MRKTTAPNPSFSQARHRNAGCTILGDVILSESAAADESKDLLFGNLAGAPGSGITADWSSSVGWRSGFSDLGVNALDRINIAENLLRD
jgi:hypothetical protein